MDIKFFSRPGFHILLLYIPNFFSITFGYNDKACFKFNLRKFFDSWWLLIHFFGLEFSFMEDMKIELTTKGRIEILKNTGFYNK